jgi:hypothetical protein
VLGSGSAAYYELATGGEPVMAIDGFNGNGGLLTLAQFKHYVAAGDIHYFLGGTGAISSWIEAHYAAQTIGGTTVYDLSR